MKQKIAKLIDVKSLVTLTLTGVFAALACTNFISAENYMAIYTMIIGFYFGTQAQKRADGNS